MKIVAIFGLLATAFGSSEAFTVTFQAGSSLTRLQSTPASTSTSTDVGVQETVASYTSAPLATVSGDEPEESSDHAFSPRSGYDKRSAVTGVQAVIRQQQELNVHVHNNGGGGDSSREINSEFTFLL